MLRTPPKQDHETMNASTTDWTSTYGLDASRGYCRPPVEPPDLTPRFTIAAGTSVRVAKVEAPEAKTRHVMRKTLDFDSYERWDRDEFCYVFRENGYLIWCS